MAVRHTPRVSIIVCCYNQGEFVGQAVESALQQTYPNVEVIVIDNGSTDHSRDVLKKYEYDPRVTLIFNATNETTTKCCQDGVRRGTGEYISYLYADDYYLPEKIERQMACFEGLAPDYGVVYTPAYRWNVLTDEKWQERSFTRSGSILKGFLLGFHPEGPICPISPLIKRECLLRYPFREESFVEAEAIFLRIAMTYKFQYLGEPLVVMREHMSNMGKAIKKNRGYGLYLMGKLLEEPDLPANCRRAVKIYMARMLRNYGWQAMRVSKESAWARESFLLAVEWDPLQALHPRTWFGMGLTFLPDFALRWANRLGYFLKHPKVNLSLKDDYT